MMNRIDKTKYNSYNNGFTLVELIVVLVILALLAAILIPALLGFIEKSKDQQDIINAKNCMTAVQAELVELYALNRNIPADASIIDGANVINNANKDVNASKTAFVDKVYKTAGIADTERPYLFFFGVGSNKTGSPSTEHDKYTVYYSVYMAKKNSKPLYFYCDEWTNVNPRKDDKTEIFDKSNVIKDGPYKGKMIQYYLISNSSSHQFKNGDFWNWLKSLT